MVVDSMYKDSKEKAKVNTVKKKRELLNEFHKISFHATKNRPISSDMRTLNTTNWLCAPAFYAH
jgi:hypothetical protein